MERIETPTLPKYQLQALEKIFAAEIEGHLPFQSTASVYKKLEADGLVRFGKETLSSDCLGAITVEGWYLTHAGRLMYCMSC